MGEITRNHNYTVDLNKPLMRQSCGILLGQGDSNGDCFCFTLVRDGDAVNPGNGAEVTAFFIRQDGNTVYITVDNTNITNNCVSVTLPESCYAIGRFSLAVKVEIDGEKTTIAILDGYVWTTQTDTWVDPGTEVPSLAALYEQVKAIEDKATAAAASAKEAKASADEAATLLYTGAGSHNAVYRGKYLGSAVTSEQWAAIAAGTFEDLYIGDYWTIGGVNYRIAAFDYYYKTGDTSCTTHHVTIVPDSNMYSHCMNDSNVTTGAYIGSKMYASGLDTAKTTINNAFGSAHILNHRQYLQNATTSGYASAGSWYDSTVELMTEQNVYGCKIFGNCINGTAFPNNYTVDKSQYPLFTHRPDMISNRQWFWLRDVASAAYFCYVASYGGAGIDDASGACGVRPAFSIC